MSCWYSWGGLPQTPVCVAGCCGEAATTSNTKSFSGDFVPVPRVPCFAKMCMGHESLNRCHLFDRWRVYAKKVHAPACQMMLVVCGGGEAAATHHQRGVVRGYRPSRIPVGDTHWGYQPPRNILCGFAAKNNTKTVVWGKAPRTQRVSFMHLGFAPAPPLI